MVEQVFRGQASGMGGTPRRRLSVGHVLHRQEMDEMVGGRPSGGQGEGCRDGADKHSLPSLGHEIRCVGGGWGGGLAGVEGAGAREDGGALDPEVPHRQVELSVVRRGHGLPEGGAMG